MAAFEKIKSGLNGLDIALHNIRLGDNVVWQLSSIEEYSFFVKPFVAQAIADKRNIIYIRFAEHLPIVPNQPGLKRVYLDPNIGFESFTVKVNEIISNEGIDSFYVFDCLSELQVEWGTDLMMGNFFTVTCPYLFELDTVAYFGILRNRHSFDTIARIRDTTQLLIDVYGSGDEMYVHPLKVWNRYSQSMFLAHKFKGKNGEELEPLTDGISASKFYSLMAG
ncbi:MAG: phosphoenolpyruvate synthase, partial [Clostridiaceae bacterium]|nr:phosphoenolpyruvate synthase [Clostridiaceae bacterium]